MKKLLILLIAAGCFQTVYCQSSSNENETMFAAMDKAFNDHNMKEYFSYFADDCVFWNSVDYKVIIKSKQAMESQYNGWFYLIPDMKASVIRRYSMDNIVVEEFEFGGTIKVVPPGFPETIKDKSFSTRACSVSTLENGKIKSVNMYYDYISMLNQLGWTNIVPGH